VLEYGPGELPLLHAVDERVRIDSLEKAVLVYENVMKHYS
jgi:succinyl-diaminopimelate desuccinylase